jgi:hypothetical protein
MKRLACLCALFFAGHVMAQTTCSNATFKGTYDAVTLSGELAAGVHFYAVARAVGNGDGTGTATFKYTETGGLLNNTQAVSFPGTVDANCNFTATTNVAGIPVTVVGYIRADGSKIYLVTQSAGITINGVAERE